MQLLATLVFAGVASASLQSPVFLAGRSLGERQGSCEEAFGPGNVNCIRRDMCYNPDAGEVCCSNGEYCKSGYYCALPYCCKNGQSLEECGATATLSTIPPPAATKPPSGSTSRPRASTPPTSPVTVTTSLPPVVTAGAGKNTEVGALAAIGGLAALLLAV